MKSTIGLAQTEPAVEMDIRPLSLPQSPPPVHANRSTRSSVKMVSSDDHFSQAEMNGDAITFDRSRLSSGPAGKRAVSIPRKELANGAQVQQSPSSIVQVHESSTPYLPQPSSASVEEDSSKSYQGHTRLPSRGRSPLRMIQVEDAEEQRQVAGHGSSSGQENYDPGYSETQIPQVRGASTHSHSQIPSLTPEIHLNPGAYRHVSAPIVEPRQPSEEEIDQHEPLQYHHYAHEPALRPIDKRASKLTIASSNSGGSNDDSRHDHLAPADMRSSSYGRALKRPDSGFSSTSDLRGRARSPRLSAGYARAVSAHSTGSPDTRPLSYVDLLNVPYPQPPPVSADALDNSQLRTAVGTNASLLGTRQTLEMYRANVKKTNDPAIQYEFAVFMINAAQEVNPDMQSLNLSGETLKTPVDTSGDLLKEARQILQRLSDRSYPFAQYYLADGYFSGLFNKGKPDYDKAFPLFISAAKHGHAEAGYRAALCYEFGWGCRTDGAKAVPFYRQAASKNHPGAMLRLAKACLIGDMGLSKRYREGVKWLKRAAESADYQYNQAPYDLGLLHETGYGDDIFKDESYTAQLFTKSADLGHAEASYRLGDAYEHGNLSCPKDPALAVHFYTGAAERDHPMAQMALCAWYMVGAEPVLEKDENEAYQWALKAAEQGLAKAEYAVGYFSESGLGCRVDTLAANHWFSMAAQHGDERAIHRMAAISAAATGADPVTAALPAGKRKALKPSGSHANIVAGELEKRGAPMYTIADYIPDGEKPKGKKFGVF